MLPGKLVLGLLTDMAGMLSTAMRMIWMPPKKTQGDVDGSSKLCRQNICFMFKFRYLYGCMYLCMSLYDFVIYFMNAAFLHSSAWPEDIQIIYYMGMNRHVFYFHQSLKSPNETFWSSKFFKHCPNLGKLSNGNSTWWFGRSTSC